MRQKPGTRHSHGEKGVKNIRRATRRPYSAEEKIRSRIEDVGEDHIATNVIVAGELRYGARKKGTASLIDRINAVLSRLKILGDRGG